MLIAILVVDLLSFVLMILVLLMQILSFRRHSDRKSSWYLKSIIIGAMLSTITYRGLQALSWYDCSSTTHCVSVIMISNFFYNLSRASTFLFYLHRAKLSQGMEPVFPDIFFTKIFPAATWISCVVVGVFVTIYEDSISKYCAQPDTFGLSRCIRTVNDTNYYILAAVIVVEVFLTLFFLFLFLRPIHLVQAQTDRRNQTLKRMIQINIAGTTIGMVSTNITEVLYFAGYSGEGLMICGILDAVINVISMYCMLKPNRDFAKNCFCACCALQMDGEFVGLSKTQTKYSLTDLRMKVVNRADMIASSSVTRLSSIGPVLHSST